MLAGKRNTFFPELITYGLYFLSFFILHFPMDCIHSIHTQRDGRTDGMDIHVGTYLYIYILATAESIYEEGRPHRDTHREKEPVNLVWGLAFISCLSSCYVSCPHEVEVVEYHTRLRTNPLSLSLSVVVSLLLYLKHFFFLLLLPQFLFLLSCLFILLSQATRRVLYIHSRTLSIASPLPTPPHRH